jgi:excisionase family DNA binding protein
MADPQMLTVPQAAERLGLKQSTIRAWMLRRRIEFVRLGKRAVRISQAELERLIAEGTVPRREGR